MKNELHTRILSSLFLFPLSLYIIIYGSYLFKILIIFLFLISSYEWFKISLNKIWSFIGIFYLFFSFFVIYLLRIKEPDGYIFFLLVYFICVATDTGGYFFGRLIGGPKLTKISPNKTISGSICGILLSLTLIYFYLFIIKYFFGILILYDLNLIFKIIFLSISSQVGDIIVSYFKRISNNKDTGKIIPGHGGLLDRIDGMLFAFPLGYFLNNL